MALEGVSVLIQKTMIRFMIQRYLAKDSVLPWAVFHSCRPGFE